MQRIVASTLAATLVVALAAAAAAQRGRPPADGRAPAGAARAAPAERAAPVERAAPAAARPAPAPPPAARAGGFDFHNDLTARPASPAQQPARPESASRQPAPVARRPPAQPNGPVAGRPVANPHRVGSTWGWNHGQVWQPAPIYWGGGFWGPFALSTLAAAVAFGSIVDYQNQVVSPSYQAEPDSPGAALLQNYGLQQTPCGPPDLVVIWGPGNSVICAFPNDLVGAGTYDVDPSTLTLVSPSS